MLRSVSIVPSILTNDKQDFRNQIESINRFARRAQIDVTDGQFAEKTTIDITNIWWPKTWEADVHLMFLNPSEYMDIIIKLHPSLCILHAEAGEDLLPSFDRLKEAGIKTGVALLKQTYPPKIKAYIDAVDHVLIFAGELGQQGGKADMMQMEKIPLIRNMKPEVEIGWDGGVNFTNMRALAHADLDVINVGSTISKAEDPMTTFNNLIAEIDKNGVVL